MIKLPKDRSFQLWDYRVSHGFLLIRSPKKGEQKLNIDIKFFGVEYISLPRHLKEIVASNANESEIQFLEHLLDKTVAKEKVYVLEAPTGRHLVVAAGMKVDENELDIFDSPYD